MVQQIKLTEILEGYRDKIKIFILKHVTISELRNHGASVAKYGWLAFIDGDVELSRTGIKNLLEDYTFRKKKEII